MGADVDQWHAALVGIVDGLHAQLILLARYRNIDRRAQLGVVARTSRMGVWTCPRWNA